MSLRERLLELSTGVSLHVVEDGPEDGSPVVLLHGFPEFRYGWRHQVGPLAEAGCRVIVPDQRGYGLSDKPRGLGPYRLDRLTGDVEALLGALDTPRAVVVGHDWGGMVAWWLAMTRPHRVSALVALNIPHPAVMRRFLRRDPAQRRRSRYVFFFQLPWLPERRLSRDGFAELERALRATSRPGTFSDADLERYREAWSRPGALRGMLAWYRAALRRPPPRPTTPVVEPPVRLVWGAEDRFLGAGMVEPSIELCRDGRSRLVEDATHWIQHEEPALVNRTILDAVADAQGPPGTGTDTAP